jgi:serine/threonine protein kinase
MDSIAAKRLIHELVGKGDVGGWKIVKHRGSGKSAVVFDAVHDGALAALKVFDPDLVEKSGKGVQPERIRRELTLRGKSHPNLIKILDGGECTRTGYLFIVMELLDAPNLASVIDAVPRDRIRLIISQVASAAKFLLEDMGLVHRDIKTDNIAITPDFNKATLLDLGVIRPLTLTDGEPSSDGERRSFVGTLRYSSPEYAFRRGKEDPEAWRALTFYQLGGVLHDLIMRKRLFEEFSDPYTRLVKAVDIEIPIVNSPEVPDDIVLLARNCLLKRPDLRLRFVKWSDFDHRQPVITAGVTAKEHLRRRFAIAQDSGAADVEGTERSDRLLRNTVQTMQCALRNEIVSECAGRDFLPRVESQEFQGSSSAVGYLLLTFQAAPAIGFSQALSILFKIEVLEQPSNVVQIGYAAAAGAPGLRSEEAADVKVEALFSGVFQAQVVKTTAMDVVYQTLDTMQQVSTATGARWLAGSIKEAK